MGEKENEKSIKSGKKIIIVFILIAIIFASFGFYLVYRFVTDIPTETKEYSEIVATDEDKSGTYVKLDLINYMEFSKKDEGADGFYLVQDEEGFYYIVKLSSKTQKALEDEYEVEKNDFSYELKGYLINLPEDVKILAVDSLNKIFKGYSEESDKEADVVSTENLYKYVGYNYLDDSEIPNSSMYIGVFILLFLLSIIFVILAIVFRKQQLSTKK